MRNLSSSFLLAVLFSCNSNREEVTAVSYDSTVIQVDSMSASNKVLLKNVTRTHFFSDPLREETFSLSVSGSNLMEAFVDFNIVSGEGKEIYSQRFETAFLLVSISDLPVDSVVQVDSVRERINNFFAEDNFIQPAIANEMVYDPNYSDKSIWDEVKANRKTMGFKYQLGKEDSRRIACFRSKGAVQVYFNCCWCSGRV